MTEGHVSLEELGWAVGLAGQEEAGGEVTP